MRARLTRPARAPRATNSSLLVVAAALALGLFGFRGVPEVQTDADRGRPGGASLPAKSIAVLPFQNLSKDEENAFFADGVQDQILTDLAKVADLKVISRMSAMQYKNAATRNLREIAQQLGVAHVLEGSVQRSGGKVRVTAQLINARTDVHEWAENFDRPIDDVFAIQSAIAEQLQAKISPREKAAMSQAPTTDLTANKLYVHAKALAEPAGNDPNGSTNLLEAVRLLNEAVERDPRFLLAYTFLAQAHLELYWNGFDHTPSRRELANAAIQRASGQQPDAGEVHLALADLRVSRFPRLRQGSRRIDRARATLPNSADLYDVIALIDRRQGRWSEATRNFARASELHLYLHLVRLRIALAKLRTRERVASWAVPGWRPTAKTRNFARASELHPRNFGLLSDAASTFGALRRYEEARKVLQQALAILPQDYAMRIQLAGTFAQGRADTGQLQSLMSTILAEEPAVAPRIAVDLFFSALITRDPAAMQRALAVTPPEGLQEESNFLAPRECYVGLAARAFNDNATARSSFTVARGTVEQIIRGQPDYAAAWSALGLIDAGLGRKDDAVREGRRACELLPITSDALTGPVFIANFAIFYSWTGDLDQALEQLTLSAQMPGGVTEGELKLDPRWETRDGGTLVTSRLVVGG